MDESTKSELLNGASKELRWASLDWFEEERLKIAEAVSKATEIPLSEFEDTEDTASFHFLTLVIAIGDWLYENSFQYFTRRGHGTERENEEIAREKVVAGILLRLLSHRFNQDLGSIPNFQDFIRAFTKFSGRSHEMTLQILSAYSYLRLAAITMAHQLKNGQIEMSLTFFDGHNQFLERDKDGFMPRQAVMDATHQLYYTLTFVEEMPNFPSSIKNVPDDPQATHDFLRNYLRFAGVGRRPALVDEASMDFKNVSLKSALDSIQSDRRPKVLIDSIFEKDGKLTIALPFITSDSQNLSIQAKSLIQRADPELAKSLSLFAFPYFGQADLAPTQDS